MTDFLEPKDSPPDLPTNPVTDPFASPTATWEPPPSDSLRRRDAAPSRPSLPRRLWGDDWYRPTAARLAVIAGGALLAVGQVWIGLAPIEILGLAILIAVVRRQESAPQRLLLSLVAALTYTICMQAKLLFPPSIGACFAMATGGELILFLLGASILEQARRGLPLIWNLLIGPIELGAWLAIADWTRSQLDPFWGTAPSLARSWVAYPEIVPLARFGGAAAIVFVLGATATLVANVILPQPLHQSVPQPVRGRIVAVLVLLLACGPAGWGMSLGKAPESIAASSGENALPSLTLRVSVVGWAGFPKLPEVRQRVEKALAGHPDLLLLPEAVFPISDRAQLDQLLSHFRRYAHESGAVIGMTYFDRPLRKNRFLFIRPDGSASEPYDKNHLIPLLENYHAGDGHLIVEEVKGVRIGSLICHDDNFCDLTQRYAELGVNVLAVATNDWYQVRQPHLENCRLRAMQSGMVLARASQNGISAVISPEGVILAECDHFAKGSQALTVEVPIDLGLVPTLADQWGDRAIVAACVLLAMSFAISIGTAGRWAPS